MKINKFGVAAICLVAFIIAAFFAIRFFDGGTTVTVTNATKEVIPEVLLKFEHHSQTIARLSPGKSASFHFSQGDDSLQIIANLSSGTSQSSKAIYTTSGIDVVSEIHPDHVSIDYKSRKEENAG